jgi:hypothetical protein
MAFQLQTLPQFAPYDPLGSIAQGYAKGQEANTRRLEQERMRIENKTLDQKINAEIAALLATTEQTEMQNKLQRDYGELAFLTEMAYKNAIGTAAKHNAEVGALNAYIAQQKLPGDIANIEAQNRQAQLNNEIAMAVIESMRTGKPVEEIMKSPEFGTMGGTGGQIPLPPLDGVAQPTQGAVQPTAVTRGTTTAIPVLNLPSKNPQDYATPEAVETLDLSYNLLSPYKGAPQKAQDIAEAEETGRQSVKGYYQLEREAGTNSNNAINENEIIRTLVNTHGAIPWWNKEALGGLLPPAAQKSKLFESLLSGSTLSVLGDQKGVASDFDAQMIRDIFGNRTFDEINLKELLLLKEIQNDRKVGFQKFVADNEGKSRGTIERDWNNYLQDNSLFDDRKWQNYLIQRRQLMDPEQQVLDELAERERKEAHEELMDQKYGRTE